jgi:hypothetical protein
MGLTALVTLTSTLANAVVVGIRGTRAVDELHATQRIFTSTPDAITHARDHLQRAGALSGSAEGDLVGAGQ